MNNPYQTPASDVEATSSLISPALTAAGRSLGKALLVYLPLDLLFISFIIGGSEPSDQTVWMVVAAIETVFAIPLIIYLLKSSAPRVGPLYITLFIGFGLMTVPRVLVLMVFLRRFGKENKAFKDQLKAGVPLTDAA